MSDSLSIALQNVTKQFGAVQALSRINHRLQGGQVCVLRGASGAGKSTLLAMLGTLLHPSLGSIDYGTLGRDIQTVRKQIGWLGTNSLCYPDLTGKENLTLTAHLYGVPPLPVWEQACTQFDLLPWGERPVRTYSQGQRQRLALARMQIGNPRLWLLDEPTTGLDESSMQTLQTILRNAAQGGAVVVVATHDASFAQAIADDMLLLHEGRLSPSAHAARGLEESA